MKYGMLMSIYLNPFKMYGEDISSNSYAAGGRRRHAARGVRGAPARRGGGRCRR